MDCFHMSQKKGAYKKLTEIVEQLNALEPIDSFSGSISWTLEEVAQDEFGLCAWIKGNRVKEEFLSELRNRLNNRRLRLISWEVGNTPSQDPVMIFIRFKEYEPPTKKEKYKWLKKAKGKFSSSVSSVSKYLTSKTERSENDILD